MKKYRITNFFSADNMDSRSRSKRTRTTFNVKQKEVNIGVDCLFHETLIAVHSANQCPLQALVTSFQRDQSPDNIEIERLAKLTALKKRVIQVWFQNSRARRKKAVLCKSQDMTCHYKETAPHFDHKPTPDHYQSYWYLSVGEESM